MGYVTVLVQHNWAMQPAPSPPPPPSPQPPSDSKHLGNHHHHHHEHRNHNHPPPTRASRHTPRLQIRDRGRHHVHFRDQLKPDDKRVGAVRAFVPDSVRQFVEAVDDAVDRGVCGGPTPTRPGGVGRSDGKAGAFAGDEPWLWGGEKEYERRRERAANRAIWEVWIGRRPGVNGEDDHDDESEVEGRSEWRNACRAMRRAAKLIARLAPLALSSEVADPFRWDYVREACRTGNWIVPADLNGLNSPVGGVHPRAAPSAGSPASPITSGPKKTDGKKFRRRYEEPLGDREDGGAEATLAAKRARRRCAALARRSVLVLSRVSVPTSVPLQCWTGQSPVLVHGAAAGEFLPEERALDVEAAGRESVRFVAWIRARCYEVLREALDTNELATDDEEVASLLLIISELEDAISASLEDLQGLEASEAENGSGKRTFIETGIECLVTCLWLALQRLDYAYDARAFHIPLEVIDSFHRLVGTYLPELLKSAKSKQTEESRAADIFHTAQLEESFDIVNRIVTLDGKTEEILSQRIALSFLAQAAHSPLPQSQAVALLQPFTGILNDLRGNRHHTRGFLKLVATAAVFSPALCRLFVQLVESTANAEEGDQGHNSTDTAFTGTAPRALAAIAATAPTAAVRAIALRDGLCRWATAELGDCDGGIRSRMGPASVRGLSFVARAARAYGPATPGAAAVGLAGSAAAAGVSVVCLEAVRSLRQSSGPAGREADNALKSWGAAATPTDGAGFVSMLFKYLSAAAAERFAEGALRDRFLEGFLRSVEGKAGANLVGDAKPGPGRGRRRKDAGKARVSLPRRGFSPVHGSPIEDDRREEEEDDVIKDMREDEEAKKDGVSIPKTLPLSTGPYHNNYERVNDGSTVDSSARPTGSNTPEFARDANAAASDPLGPSSLTVRYADPVAEAASAAVIAGWRQVGKGVGRVSEPATGTVNRRKLFNGARNQARVPAKIEAPALVLKGPIQRANLSDGMSTKRDGADRGGRGRATVSFPVISRE